MPDKPFLFIHIPKTGGTSVYSAMGPHSWDHLPPPFTERHEPLFSLENRNKLSDFYKFCVCRDPYTRTYSMYKHLLRYMDLSTFHEDPLSFTQFLHSIRYNQHQKFAKYNPYHRKTTTPFTFLPQSFYVFDSACKMNIDRVFKFEKLNELEDELGFKLGKLNSGNYPAEELEKALTAENISLINHIYKEDFAIFEYPMMSG